jgi:hypothetical protein
MVIPPKIYEYMCHDAWLLVLAEPGSATEQLRRETDADVLTPQGVDGIANTL